MITQHDLDMIANPRAFDPPPSSLADEPGFSWLAGIGFIVLLAVLVLMA